MVQPLHRGFESEVEIFRQTLLASYFAYLNGQFTTWGNFGFYEPKPDEYSCIADKDFVCSNITCPDNLFTEDPCITHHTDCDPMDIV